MAEKMTFTVKLKDEHTGKRKTVTIYCPYNQLLGTVREKYGASWLIVSYSGESARA